MQATVGGDFQVCVWGKHSATIYQITSLNLGFIVKTTLNYPNAVATQISVVSFDSDSLLTTVCNCLSFPPLQTPKWMSKT